MQASIESLIITIHFVQIQARIFHIRGFVIDEITLALFHFNGYCER